MVRGTMVLADLKSIVLHWSSRDRPAGADDAARDPSDPTCFAVNVQAFIGPQDADSSDSFDFLVCTPSWLAANPDRIRDPDDELLPPALLMQRGIWLASSWSVGEIESAIRRLCDHVSPGPDWGTVADRLGRWMPWEYDYKYDEFRDAQQEGSFPPVLGDPAGSEQ